MYTCDLSSTKTTFASLTLDFKARDYLCKEAAHSFILDSLDPVIPMISERIFSEKLNI